MTREITSVFQRLTLTVSWISITIFLLYQILFIKLHGMVAAGRYETFKFAEITSLTVMFFEGKREVVDVLVGQEHGLSTSLILWYRIIRTLIAFAVAFGIWTAFYPVGSEWFRTYAINAALLFPILLYAVPNYLCVQNQAVPDKIREHMSWYLYFANMPITASIVAFFVVCWLIMSPDGTTKLFVGGASALMLFLSHAVSVCIDQHANNHLYNALPRGVDPMKRKWYFVTAVCLIALGGAISVLLFGDASLAARATGRLGILAGLVLVTHALWADGWNGFQFSMVIGSLYAVVAACVLFGHADVTFSFVSVTLLVAISCRMHVSWQLTSHWGKAFLAFFSPALMTIYFIMLVYMGHIVSAHIDDSAEATWLASVLLGADISVHGLWLFWLSWGAKFARVGALSDQSVRVRRP